MGCPVIAARAGGPVEIVEDGISGLPELDQAMPLPWRRQYEIC